MNKKLIGFIAIILVTFAAFSYKGQIVKAIGILLRSGADVPTGPLAMQTSTSTTTPNFLQNGKGTTTMTFASDNFSSLTLYLQVTASSSNYRSPLNVQLQASDDNINFFDYDPTVLNTSLFVTYHATSSGIELASTTRPYIYQPALHFPSTTTKVVNLNLLPARYTRIIFTISTTTPNGASTPYFDGMNLWASVVGKMEGAR